MKDVLDLVGRVALSCIFLFEAAKGLLHVADTKVMMVSQGIEHYNFHYVVGAFLTVLGGLMVLLGYRPRLGAFLLILFLIPTTFFYPLEAWQESARQVIITKNLVIMGGLLMVMAHGTGKYSLRRILASTHS